MHHLVKSVLREVTSDKLFIDSQKKHIDQDGLLSEVIFGTTKSLSCSCGALRQANNINKRCDKCGVICEPSSVRYNRFGKITLPLYVINYLNIDRFKKIVPKEYKQNLLDPMQFNLVSSLKLFLEYNQSKDSLRITDKFNSNCVPLKISSSYTLYIALTVIYIKHNSSFAQELLQYFYKELLVLPPECRVVLNVSETNRNLDLIKSRVVDIYQQIIRTKKTIENDKNLDIESISNNLINYLIEMWDDPTNKTFIDDSTVQMIERNVTYLQFYTNQLYNEVLVLLSGKKGMIRQDVQGKNIDYSARAVVINDPTLRTHQIKLPKTIFFKLWTIEYLGFLRKKEYADINLIGNLSKLLQPIAKSEININIDDYEYFDEFVEYFFSNEYERKKRLVYINRQPTLWRYGLFGVEVVGLTDNDTISVSPIIVPSLGMDFDGDTAAIYRVHDSDSINELYENAFILNLVEFDHTPQLIHGLTQESKYGYEVLRLGIIDNNLPIIEINSLLDIVYDNTINIKTGVKFNDAIYPYGIILLNIFAGFNVFNEIIIDQNTTPDQAVRYILDSSLGDNDQYHFRLTLFSLKINWFLTTNQLETLTLPFIESGLFINKANNNPLIKKLPKNPYIGQHIYQSVIDKEYNSIPKDYQLYKLTKSKFNQTQFARSLVSIGYLADNHNKISPKPVTSNILSGLTEDEFFEASFGTRKGIVDKDKNVPTSGRMERDLVINLSTIEVVEDNCGTKFGMRITIKNKKHNESLINRYFINKLGELELYEPLEENIGKTFVFRSPITCKTPNFRICKKCIGETKFNSPFVGILTGQYVQERMTQLTMSSFHTSGSATLELDTNLKEFIGQYLTNIESSIDGHHTILEFNEIEEFPDYIIETLTSNPDFKFVGIKDNNKLEFENYTSKVDNQDVGKIIASVQSILKTQDQPNIIPIEDAYYQLIDALHQVSTIYSLFLEVILANLYVNKENKVIRYALNDGEDINVYKKYNISRLHSIQSDALSLIYQPNKTTILKYYESGCHNNISDDKLSIFERIWYGKI